MRRERRFFMWNEARLRAVALSPAASNASIGAVEADKAKWFKTSGSRRVVQEMRPFGETHGLIRHSLLRRTPPSTPESAKSLRPTSPRRGGQVGLERLFRRLRANRLTVPRR